MRPDPTEPAAAPETPSTPQALPPQQKHSGGLVTGVLLPLLGIVLLVGLVAGASLLTSRPGQRVTGPPPLYADSLMMDQKVWQCAAGATCQFEPNGLHILAPADHLYFSELYKQPFDNQVIEVTSSLDNGDPEIVGVAIAFRSIGVDGYGFLVFANGTYELVRWDPLGNVTYLIPLTTTAAIHTGLDLTNRLKVIAKGDQITLFINGQQLNQISDSTYTSGNILLGAARIFADAVFSNLIITRP